MLLVSVFRRGLGLCLSATLLAACEPKPKPHTTAEAAAPRPVTQVVGVARIEPEGGIVDLLAGAEGRIKALPVPENQVFTSGQVLLTLGRATNDAQLAEARAAVRTQRADAAAQQARLAALHLSADKAAADVVLNRQLLAAQGITAQTLRESEATAGHLRQEFYQGQAELRKARARVQELQAGVELNQAQAQLRQVAASFAGRVLEWKVQPGDFVTATTPLAQLAPAGDLVARTEVDELFADRVRPGQRAEVRSQATGQVLSTGTVYYAADFLKRKSLFADESAQEDRRVREVRVRLRPAPGLLINGRVDCLIYLK